MPGRPQRHPSTSSSSTSCGPTSRTARGPQGNSPSIGARRRPPRLARTTVDRPTTCSPRGFYVESQPGSGYVVPERGLPRPGLHPRLRRAARFAGGGSRYDFTYGNLEPGTFGTRLAPSPTTCCCRWKAPAVTPTTTLRRAHRAWPSPGASPQRDIDCTPGQVIVRAALPDERANLLALSRRRRGHRGHGGPRLRQGALGHRQARFAIAPCRVTEARRAFLEDLGLRGAARVPDAVRQFPHLPHHAHGHTRAGARLGRAHPTPILEDDFCRDFRCKDGRCRPWPPWTPAGAVIYMGVLEVALAGLAHELPGAAGPLLAHWREKLFANSYSPVPWLNPEGCWPRFMTDGSWDRHLPSAGEEPPQVRRPHRRAAEIAWVSACGGAGVRHRPAPLGARARQSRPGSGSSPRPRRQGCGHVSHEEVLGRLAYRPQRHRARRPAPSARKTSPRHRGFGPRPAWFR